jgi:uncharacterized protein YcaQ
MTGAAARRVALAAQGFGVARPGGVVARRHLQGVLGRTQLFQLDSVNVVARAHYFPLFSRLGAYPVELLDQAAWSHEARRPRLLVEYWAHEASLIPLRDWPLLRWRMRRYEESPGRYWQAALCEPGLVDQVRAVVKEFGPISAGAVQRELGLEVARGKGGWWGRSDVKKVCEWLFAIGEITTAERRGFERQYELTERVLPPEIHAAPEVAPDVAYRELITRAAVAFGVATEPDLRDYYRLKPAASQRAVLELVEDGVLEPVLISGWRHPAYLHVDAKIPRRVTGRALLCPFDPLIWERARTERIFDFHYRIEIYVPEPKRQYGYYVFPFLLDGELVARVDLKADRAAGVLRVPGAFAEASADPARVAVELAAELRTLAGWLELDTVEIGDRGDLAPVLQALIRQPR